MRLIFPTLLAFGVGLFVYFMVWHLITRAGKLRRASLAGGEIDRAANELIEKHGDKANAAAAGLAKQCLGEGDIDGEAVWKMVEKAVEKIQADK